MPIPHPLFGPAMARLGERLGAGSLYGDAIRLLRYGRGVDNSRLREPTSATSPATTPSPRSATSRRGPREAAVPGSRRRLGARPPGRGGAMSTPTRSASIPELGARFLRGVRTAVDGGLDPLAAAEAASADLPKTLRDSIERMARRMRGEYHEDEWGFDEEFAEAAYPVLRAALRPLVAGRGDRGRERPRPRPGDARLQPRRRALPLRRLDDHRRDHEAAPAAPLAAVHGPRLGVRAAVPLRLHAQGRRRPGEPVQRDPDPRAGRADDGLPRGREGNRQAVRASATGCSASAAAGSSRSPCAPARRSSRSPSSAPRRSTR